MTRRNFRKGRRAREHEREGRRRSVSRRTAGASSLHFRRIDRAPAALYALAEKFNTASASARARTGDRQRTRYIPWSDSSDGGNAGRGFPEAACSGSPAGQQQKEIGDSARLELILDGDESRGKPREGDPSKKRS